MSWRNRPRVSVVGGGSPPPGVVEAAREVGAGLAGLDVVLVTGGLGGVMEAACEGYHREGGPLAVGILPGTDREDANPHVDLAVPTGLGHARNTLVVLNGDVVVALPGGGGTLSEVGYAAVLERPVVGVGAWEDLDHVETVQDPGRALARVADLLGDR